MQNVKEMIFDAFMDTVKLLPFLFLTYTAMEYVEHKLGKKTEEAVGRAGCFGPVLGAFAGVFPQCGFSAAASNLFAGGMITMGTLLSVFLSTSDEMLPILLSERIGIGVIVKLLGMKVLIGMAAGFLADFIVRKRKGRPAHACPGRGGKAAGVSGHGGSGEECGCGGGIFRSAVSHTFRVISFIFVFSLSLNLIIGIAGEDFIAGLLSDKPVAGPLAAGLIGLIPNCAASVVLTQLYLEGMLGAGAMMAGLLAGSGIGLLVLFRVNGNIKESVMVTVLLYVIGVAAGIFIDAAGVVI